MKKSLCQHLTAFAGIIALLLTAAISFAAEPTTLTVVEAEQGGVYTITLPAQEKLTVLYFAGTSDAGNVDYTTWSHPVKLVEVPAGDTEVTVNLQELIPDWQDWQMGCPNFRFLLVDPDRCTYAFNFVESAGNAACLTQINATPQMVFELEFELTDVSSTSFLFGSRKDSNNNFSIMAGINPDTDGTGPHFRYNYNFSPANAKSDGTPEVGVRYRLTMSAGNCSVVKVDDGTVVSRYTYTPIDSFSEQYKVALGSFNQNETINSTYAAHAKYYSFKLWENAGGKLLGDFVPMVSRATQKPGFYDAVSGEFYASVLNDDFSIENATRRESVDTVVVHLGELIGATANIEVPMMEIVESNWVTGTFTLNLPMVNKNLELFFAGTIDDNADVNDWQAPFKVANVPANTKQLAFQMPSGWNANDYRHGAFVLVDPTQADLSCEFVESAGNAGFLTDIVADAGTAYEMEFAFTDVSKQQWLICARQNSLNTVGVCMAAKVVDGIRFGYNNRGNQILAGTVENNVRYRLRVDGPVFQVIRVSDETTLFEHSFDDVQNFSATYKLGFGLVASGNLIDGNGNPSQCYPAYAKFYSFKAWDRSGGELIADYRPLQVTAVNLVGLYDMVSGKTYYSELADQFSAIDATKRVADTVVGHLHGLMFSKDIFSDLAPVVVASEEGLEPFALEGCPHYGNQWVAVGATATFTVPAEAFEFVNEAGERYWVQAAGYRLDVYDPTTDGFIEGNVVWRSKSVSWTRPDAKSGVRIVWLWSVEPLQKNVAASGALRVDCLRLVKGLDGTSSDARGLFDTLIHPNPKTTRVRFTAKIPSHNANRGFFGARDEPKDNTEIFLICQLNNDVMRVDVTGAETSKSGFPVDNVITFDFCGSKFEWTNLTIGQMGSIDPQNQRANRELTRTLPIFGQFLNGGTTQWIASNGTEIYDFQVWTNYTVAARNYVPCLSGSGQPCFYDLVDGEFCYPNTLDTSIAKYEAVFGGNLPHDGRVVIAGELKDGEPCFYVDPGSDGYGDFVVKNGASRTFSRTNRTVFGKRVQAYRIDTWVDGSGWQLGEVVKGTSVTLVGDDASVRRLVWIWNDDISKGFCIILR